MLLRSLTQLNIVTAVDIHTVVRSNIKIDSAQKILEQLAARTAVSHTADFCEGSDEAERRAHWLRLWRARIAWAVHRGIELSLERRMQCSADASVGYG